MENEKMITKSYAKTEAVSEGIWADGGLGMFSSDATLHP